MPIGLKCGAKLLHIFRSAKHFSYFLFSVIANHPRIWGSDAPLLVIFTKDARCGKQSFRSGRFLWAYNINVRARRAYYHGAITG